MFFRGRWIHWGARLMSLGPFGDACLIGVHPGDSGVRSGSPGSLWCALGVVGFVRGRWVHSGATCGSSGSSSVISVRYGGHRSVRGGWIHLVTPFGVVRFILGR